MLRVRVLLVTLIADNGSSFASNAVIRKNGFEFIGTETTIMKKSGQPAMINRYRYLKQKGKAHEEGN